MDDAPDPVGLPPSLNFLKWLVIVLMLTMIGGVITIVSLLVTRMPDGGAPALPENVTLPDGAQPQAVTIGTDFILIVTQDNRVLVFARDGSFRQELVLAD